MAPRQLRVLAVDEDEDHANYLSSMLPQFNFHVMSTKATWNLFRRAVVHGARFVVKKPLEDTAMRNIWQYLDLSDADRMEGIHYLRQGPTGGQIASESGVTDSSGDHNATEVESMNNSTSEVQESTGRNTTAQSIVNYPNSKDNETLDNCCEGDKGSEVSASTGY